MAVAYLTFDMVCQRKVMVRLVCTLLGSLCAGGVASAQVGADVPWVTYHAVDGATNGEKLASRKPTEIANEAVKRQCVKLVASGQFVEWTVSQPANALVIRHCVPDAPLGDGETFSLSLAVNGTFRQQLSLSSHHCWLYGKEPNPQKNTPSAGAPHVFFDESRAVLEGRPFQAGDIVRIYKDTRDVAPWYVIDLVDLETVLPALAMPAGFLSVLDFGAVPNDGNDDSAALKACLDKAVADGKGMWIPAGTFHQSEPLIVSRVTVRGAGPWHTRLTGVGLPNPKVFMGNMGIRLTGSDMVVADLSIEGNLTARGDRFQHGISSSNLGGSPDRFRLENLWVHHTQTGCWIGPVSNGVIRHCRFRNTYADGLHLNQKSHDMLVEHNHCRGNGDDGLVIHAGTDGKGVDGTCRKLTLHRNTIEGQWWGNGMAIYGGEDIIARQNLVIGANRGAGFIVAAGTSYPTWPLNGLRIVENVLLNCGGSAQNQTWPGLHIYSAGQDIKGLLLQGNTIRGATHDAIKIQGSKKETVLEAIFAMNYIDSPLAYGIHGLTTARGRLTLVGNRFTDIPMTKADAKNEAPDGTFVVSRFGAIGPENHMTFAADGKRLAFVASKRVQVYDSHLQSNAFSMGGVNVAALSFSSDSKNIIIRYKDRAVREVEIATGKTVSVTTGKANEKEQP